MIYYGYHYEYTNVYSDEILVLRKYPTGILRVLNTLFPLKGVLEIEFYLGDDVGTSELNGEVTHAFVDRTYIKHASKNIDKSF